MVEIFIILLVVIVIGPFVGHVLCALASLIAESPPHPECFDCNKGTCKGCIIKGGD